MDECRAGYVLDYMFDWTSLRQQEKSSVSREITLDVPKKIKIPMERARPQK